MRVGFVVAALGVGGVAHAAGFAIGEQSTVAAGTGGASTARDDDAGAAWYNPAALADGGGVRVGVGVVIAAPRIEASGEDAAGAWTASSGGVSPLPSIHASWARGKLALGLSAGVPFGGNVRWPDGWAGANEIVASKLEVVRIAPFAAYAVGAWRVGGGVHVDLARITLERGLDFVDAAGEVGITMGGVGVGLDLSAWRRVGAVDLGLTYKSRTAISLEGDADFEAPGAFDQKLMDQGAHTEITLPDRIALGARWRRGAVALLGDVELTAWGVNDHLEVAFDREDTPHALQQNDWTTTLAVRGGVELGRGRWVGRVGGFYDPTPTQDDARAPSSPDSSRVGATVGGSARLARAWVIDASYGYTHLLGADNTGMESITASYAGRAHMLGLAVRFTR